MSNQREVSTGILQTKHRHSRLHDVQAIEAGVVQSPKVSHLLLQMQQRFGNRYVRRAVESFRSCENKADGDPDVKPVILRVRNDSPFASDTGVHTSASAHNFESIVQSSSLSLSRSSHAILRQQNTDISKTERIVQESVQITGTASPSMIQLSPLSDELEQCWRDGMKGEFFERLRNRMQSDPDVLAFIEGNLKGDDLWLAKNLCLHGSEAMWPIDLKVEREMKRWPSSGGKATVFNILREAKGSQSNNADLTVVLNRVFAPASDDIWFARNLQTYGPEANWPTKIVLEQLWRDGMKGEFFERLRNRMQSDPDILAFIEGNLKGDDLWLAKNLYLHGSEAMWPIHLRIEREMKGWADSGGKNVVFDILRNANGTEAGNAELTKSIKTVFPNGTQDRWLAHVLQALGPEKSWPAYLKLLWTDIQKGIMPVPRMEVSGAELKFEDIALPNETAYNCYEYAMGETSSFRQPGGGVAEANMTRSGVLTLLTSDIGKPIDCDTACPSSADPSKKVRKIMAVVTDDAIPGKGGLVKRETQPSKIIYWTWDFHFYRQDIGGIWSHKPGEERHRLTDTGGERIPDPRTANRTSSWDMGIVEFGKPVWQGVDYRNIVGCWCVAPGTR